MTKRGRPAKFKTPEELQKKIIEFFKEHAKNKTMPTKGNLALFLKVGRDCLGDYKKKEDFADTIKEAYNIIEDCWVQKLTKHSVAGVIFYLKNAFKKDWRDSHLLGGDSGNPLYIQFDGIFKASR